MARAQEVGFTQFFVNPALLNPSYVGVEGRPAAFLSYRKQWVGIEGSPQVMNFSVQTALPNRVNLGLNLSNTQMGLVSSSAALVSGGYTLPLATDNFIRFGMSIGAASTQVDVAKLNFGSAPGINFPNDPMLANLAGTTIQMAGNLGVSYHNKGFHGGIALPTLFQPVYLSSSSFGANFKPIDNIVIHASNRFMLQKGKNAVEPYVVYRLSKGLPGQFEIAALFHYQHLGWIGASYRQEYGMSGLVGFKMNKILAVGYSYSLPASGENSIGRASHEIQLAFLFGKPRKEVVQLYSFVDTEIKQKKTAREPQLVVKKTTPTKPAPTKPAPAKPQPTETKPVTPAPAPVAAAPVVDAQHHEEQEKISRLDVHADNPLETHNETHHPHAERHEFVKRGNHTSEMPLGDYIIAGVFRSEENARKYSEGLKKMGFPDIDYGYLSDHKLWYVHISGSDDIEEARKRRDEFRKLRIFRDAWLLTVHE